MGRTTRKTNEQYKRELKEISNDNIISKEDYINSQTKILHYCKKHNYDFYARPLKLLAGQGCKYCGLEKIGIKKRMSIEEFKERLYETWGDEFILLDDEYKPQPQKMLFLHNIKGKEHTFYSTANSLLSKQKCGVCTGQQVCKGYNDLNTLYPNLTRNLVNSIDGDIVTPFSSKDILVKCPQCEKHIEMKVKDYVLRGISCPRCSDGISYPNKFMFNCLSQIENKLDFLEREYSPEWGLFYFNGKLRTCRYDIYFSINNKQYIVEMDGGLNHAGERTLGLTREECLYIDEQKDILANKHDIDIIRIDCDYDRNDRYEYIKTNILNSNISKIVDIKLIDFDKANIESQNSLIYKACELWNDGMNLKDIANNIRLHPTTITRYLENGSKYNWCINYNKKESRCRSTSNEVFCITTNEYFRSIVDGARKYNINPSDISKCCRRQSTHAGVINGEPMIWLYYKNYITLTDKDISNYIPMENGNYTKVICLNNNYLFNMMKTAAEWCGQKSSGGILNCCKGKYKTSGKHPETNEPLVWMYYKDYIKIYGNDNLEEYVV